MSAVSRNDSYILSEPRQKALEKSQNIWQTVSLHPSTLQFRTEAIEAFGFYEGGLGQWRQNDLDTVTSRGQLPMTVNIIQSRIDSLSGVEIQSRFRTSVKNNSYDEGKEKLARALTSQLYFVQKEQRMPYKGSLKFRDMLVCGIGWSNQYQENGKFYYEQVHPFNIMPDPDDLTPQFDNMKYVCRKRWLDPETVMKLWPKVAKRIDFSNPYLCTTLYSPEIMDRSSNYTNINNYTGYAQSRVLVCEVQYKVPRTAYCGMDYQGFYFETFDEEKAEELANSPKDIETKDSSQIMRTLFLDNYLLQYSPLNPNIPGLEDCSYIPCVWKRRFKTGVSYGLLDSTKDVQRDSNVRLTKSLYLSNSSRLIITGALPPGESIQTISEQVKRPDSVIVLPEGTQYELRNNDPMSESNLKMLDKYDMLMQRITGIYDDAMGRETNASSGVAQRQRQINSIRNNVFAFDSFADMKEREARFMLALFQSGDNENILSQIMTEDEKETIILNLTRTIKGKKYVFNDVRTLPVSLEIEEVPDFSSSMEENKAALENLLSNPNGMLIMQSPSLMRRLGIRDYQKLAEEMKETMMQNQQGGSGQPQSPQISQGSSPLPQEGDNLAYAGL